MVLFLCTMLSEIFLYSYYGTILYEENQTLTNAVYMGKWYNYDTKSRKALVILMERSKRPMLVTAGKILDLSLETFTTVLRRAYSLLAEHQEMKGLVEKSFRVNLLVMQVMGFYPPQKYKSLYKIYTYVVYCAFTTLIPVLATLELFLAENINLEQISDNAFIVCEAGCFIIKYLPFVRNADKIKKSLFLIERPMFHIYTKRQEHIIEECVAICRRNCRLFLTFCTITVINWSITPFFLPGNNLPVEIWSPFEHKASRKFYFLSFVYIVAGVGNAAVSSGVIDPLLAGLISHATSQLKVLKNNLQFLDEHAEERIASRNISFIERKRFKADFIYQQIKLCVNHHIAITEFIDVYEDTYSSSVFIQFAASVVVICISCLRLSMVEPFTFTFFVMALFLWTMLCEIFLYCYYGTILYEENHSLTNAIYMGKWYNYDIKSMKALVILMERSKRPMIVTAGKILDLSLETFTTVKRSFDC
ncbi:Odorant receptor 94a-like Protein [Tribolium castaneum]|uniref:Odorant receptor n=1 Tax=Tribolium castaneum TaxID=7070 RepID=A0A139WMK1_TRICA|nr:Odorant receptor 94a-like Protein [Tribolium castaneum]